MDLRAHGIRWAGTAAALVMVAACSAAPDPTAATSAPRAGSSAAVLVGDAERPSVAPRVALRSRVTRVAGHLTDVRRDRVARTARATVRDYLDGAFAAAEDGPSGRFLAGLRRAARADEQVLADPDAAAVTRARAWFAVAAPEGRPVGVTARLRVDLDDGGASASLTGRLLLTRVHGQWRVFGYDLARSTGGTGGGAE
jgi:hypothetical protein